MPRIDARVALSSLMALGDGYLAHTADSLRLVAASEVARAGDWQRTAALLRAIDTRGEATLWFARPDGSYWTLAHGREPGNLSSRAYFPRLMQGQVVLGDLLVSRSTGKSVAIVAVPVRGPDGTVIGALGASVYLDKLSARLQREMGLDPTMIFYAFDATPILAIVWDPSLILKSPAELGPEVRDAFADMQRRSSGVESYTFRGRRRIVLFERSRVTGWWYAFGVIPQGREPTGTMVQARGRHAPSLTQLGEIDVHFIPSFPTASLHARRNLPRVPRGAPAMRGA